MGQGGQRSERGSAANEYGYRRHGRYLVNCPDTCPTKAPGSQPIPIAFTTRAWDHIIRLGGRRIDTRAEVTWNLAREVGGKTTRARGRKGRKQAGFIGIPDEVRLSEECIMASPMVCSGRGQTDIFTEPYGKDFKHDQK